MGVIDINAVSQIILGAVIITGMYYMIRGLL
jgi:hypothetical protein